MNLAEALNAALPELPARRERVGYPKIDPNLIASENIEDGQPVIVAMIRGRDNIFRFGPPQWRIIELFDGKRSWQDVADAHAELYGVRYDVDDLRDFTSGLDEIGFWYKTPLERNVALQQKLESSRHDHAHRKSKFDVAHMQFSAWDPDRYFDRIYPWLKWIYSRWFAAVCAVMFLFMTWIFVVDWGQIGGDTLQFYNFTQKSAADLAEFWVLFLILAFFHESAHGLTCKHYGGEVHAMGFHLIYLTPAFFVDVSEAWVYATRWQRFLTILVGIGIEMIFCALATFVWWGTPAGSEVHDLAYKIMLITGVAVVVVNMNPLIKLDGYYAFSEIIGFADIKEKSTAYLSQLVRGKFSGFRLKWIMCRSAAAPAFSSMPSSPASTAMLCSSLWSAFVTTSSRNTARSGRLCLPSSSPCSFSGPASALWLNLCKPSIWINAIAFARGSPHHESPPPVWLLASSSFFPFGMRPSRHGFFSIPFAWPLSVLRCPAECWTPWFVKGSRCAPAIHSCTWRTCRSHRKARVRPNSSPSPAFSAPEPS